MTWNPTWFSERRVSKWKMHSKWFIRSYRITSSKFNAINWWNVSIHISCFRLQRIHNQAGHSAPTTGSWCRWWNTSVVEFSGASPFRRHKCADNGHATSTSAPQNCVRRRFAANIAGKHRCHRVEAWNGEKYEKRNFERASIRHSTREIGTTQGSIASGMGVPASLWNHQEAKKVIR